LGGKQEVGGSVRAAMRKGRERRSPDAAPKHASTRRCSERGGGGTPTADNPL
jgi:hypothetical protein